MVRQTLCIALLALLPHWATASEVLRVIDGDTVVISAKYLPHPLKPQLSLRVFGVDTPEKAPRAECLAEAELAAKASAFTKSVINNATNIHVELQKWDKYGGRVLGDLLIDGKSLRNLLIENGLAREYYGTKKESWCK